MCDRVRASYELETCSAAVAAFVGSKIALGLLPWSLPGHAGRKCIPLLAPFIKKGGKLGSPRRALGKLEQLELRTGGR